VEGHTVDGFEIIKAIRLTSDTKLPFRNLILQSNVAISKGDNTIM